MLQGSCQRPGAWFHCALSAVGISCATPPADGTRHHQRVRHSGTESQKICFPQRVPYSASRRACQETDDSKNTKLAPCASAEQLSDSRASDQAIRDFVKSRE